MPRRVGLRGARAAGVGRLTHPAAAPPTHADKKTAKAQAKADKKAALAQAKADKTKADAQADADKASAAANLKDAKKQ